MHLIIDRYVPSFQEITNGDADNGEEVPEMVEKLTKYVELGADSYHNWMAIKAMTIGSKNVGKTCLVNRFLTGTYTANSMTTIGYDYSYHKVNFFGQEFTMNYWDTAGDERFTIVFQRTGFVRASVILLCFDLSNPETLEDQCGIWVNAIVDHCSEKFTLLLVGCKSDIKNQANAYQQDINDYISHIRTIFRRVEYWEVSSQDNINIRELQERIIYLGIKERLYPRKSYVEDEDDGEDEEREAWDLHNTIQLHEQRPAKLKSNCFCKS